MKLSEALRRILVLRDEAREGKHAEAELNAGALWEGGGICYAVSAVSGVFARELNVVPLLNRHGFRTSEVTTYPTITSRG